MDTEHTAELAGEELNRYWRKRAEESSDRETAEMMRRSRYQDALAEIEAMAPKGSPIEIVARRALELPDPSKPMEYCDKCGWPHVDAPCLSTKRGSRKKSSRLRELLKLIRQCEQLHKQPDADQWRRELKSLGPV
jgi:hypothetical protein